MLRNTSFFMLVVFLIHSTNATGQTGNLSLSLQEMTSTNGINVKNQSWALAGATKENTVGSPYFLDNWAKGDVLFKNKTFVPEPDAILNYDKMHKKLILKKSGTEVLEIDMSGIRSFHLQANQKTYNFLLIDSSSADFALEVYKNNHYSLYKIINTKFFKADFVSRGIETSGYKYDRYVDENTWYIFQGDKNLVSFTDVNRASLKKVREAIPKSKSFLAENEPDDYKESYLIKLVDFLDK